MSSEYQQWQEVKENYLKLIEKNLAQVDHPQRSEILANVREHLDSKYVELWPEQKNWEGFQQIITEMGPPEEYAELLAEDNLTKAKSTSGINTFLAILFVTVLAAVGSYLIYTAKESSAPNSSPAPYSPLASNAIDFETDEQVLGKWVTIDFVRLIEEFNPSRKNWNGDMFLKSLAFENDGILWWTNRDGGPYRHYWTRDKVDPLDERPAFYFLRMIDGQDYLFFEWISGDVTLRGQKPAYYVLEKEE